MPTPARTTPRRVTLAAAAAALLVAGPLTAAVPTPTAAAADRSPAPAATVGTPLLAVSLDGPDVAPGAGEAIPVTGTVSTVTGGVVGAGVPGRFTLTVTDTTGRVLGTQAVTAGADGSFATSVPGAVTRTVDTSTGSASIALRALDASYQQLSADDAGAVRVDLRSAAQRLRLENSFVSSVGWVKPGQRYPSRVLLTNPTATKVTGAEVVVRAPEGTRFLDTAGPGSHTHTARRVTWRPGALAAGATHVLVLESRAATARALPTVVWRDLSTRAILTTTAGTATAVSHGPKVIPPAESYDSARYGDRPFPVVPVQYTDRTWAAGHSGEGLAEVLNSPDKEGSTFNLYQEMSLGQLFPRATVPSAGIATADFSYGPGFDFTTTDPATLNTCTGATLADSPVPAEGTPLYPERITDGVYNLPGSTQWYGADANGSAIVGSLAGVAALQQIDSGCGPTGKVVADAVAISDPEIDYSDFDTDKDGVVDFFMVVFAGCGGNGASQLGACTDETSDLAPYDNIWPHSSSLEYYLTDPATGLPGYVTDDQLEDLEGRPLYWTDESYSDMTTTPTAHKVFVRVGPYNLNPETALDKASVISHEYGHSLGLPDFYSTGSRQTYGDWNLMATDKSQDMDAFSRQELGWVVPEVLGRGTTTVRDVPDSKEDTGVIRWRTRDGSPYTLEDGRDGTVHNSRMYVAKLPGRQLLDPARFDSGDGASATHAWFSGAGNDFGCASDGGGRNLDLSVPALSDLPEGTTVTLSFASMFDIEWDYDYGYVLTSRDGGDTFTSHASTRDTPTTTTTNANQNGCQAAYSNGITGSSSSYTDPVTVQLDRATSNYPEASFVTDTFDVSDLAGAETPVLRFSYATDPGLARPGWFIDDVTVTATTPGGDQVLYSSDFETSGGPGDPFVFNGGCQPDNPGGRCTKGWQYVEAGSAASFDHAYYLELRDRSGFDLDGHGQVDRDPIGFEPGLSLVYTDEAHGYGNAGTDDPPAQSPVDAVPEPGNETPDLDDAAFTAGEGRSTFSDSGAGHTDNYTDPRNSQVDDRYPDVANPWRFTFGCLDFRVLSMSGDDLGPSTSDGNLTGDVRFRLGSGCGTFGYGWH